MWLPQLHAQLKKKHYLLYTIHTAIEVLKSHFVFLTFDARLLLFPITK